MANEEVVDHGRRRFLTVTTAVVGGVGVVAAVVPFIKSWEPSARAKASARARKRAKTKCRSFDYAVAKGATAPLRMTDFGWGWKRTTASAKASTKAKCRSFDCAVAKKLQLLRSG